MLNLQIINQLEKDFKAKKPNDLGPHAIEILHVAKKALLFDGILGNLKLILESTCPRYGAEEEGNRCCFRFAYGRERPCTTCVTRSNLGYPCPACLRVHQ